jgi:hypothetical protein
MNVISHQSGQQDGGHLSDAELFELHQGRLSPERFASVQQHLFICTQCLRAFKEVSDFFTPSQADATVPSDEQIEAGWKELKERLPLPKAWAASVSAARRWWLPLAAALFITLGGAGLLVWRAQQADRQLARMANTPTPAQASPTMALRQAATPSEQRAVGEQSRPKAAQAPGSPPTARAPFQVEELLITSGERAAAEIAQARKLFVPAQEKSFRLRLRIYNPLDYRSFRVELLDSQRRVVQGVAGKLTKDQAIEVLFQRADLADDKYFLRVSGVHQQSGQTETLESVIEVTAQRN